MYARQAIERHTATGDRYSTALDNEALANACRAAGDPAAAIEALQQAAALYTEIGLTERAASARTTLADLLEQAGRAQEALAISAAIVESAPDVAMWRRNYAEKLIKLKRLDEASAQLDIAEAQEPASPHLALRRAELAQARGDRVQAQTWATEALRRQPDWDEAKAILTWAVEMKD